MFVMDYLILLSNVIRGACHDFALEDLFCEDFFIEAIWEVYGEKLKAKGVKGVSEVKLQGDDMLWKRVDRFMKDNEIKKINKGPIAKRLARKINGMKDSSQLPCETRAHAIKLFQEIRGAL